MPKRYSFVFEDDDLVTRIDQESARLNMTLTEFFRRAAHNYFQPSTPSPDLSTVIYEILRTRAMLNQGLSKMGFPFSSTDLTEVSEAVHRYLKKGPHAE